MPLVAVLAVGALAGAVIAELTRPAGCSRPTTPPTGVPVTSASAAVGAADALFFGNRYAQAARAYVTAGRDHPRDPLVHAAYALFLTYQHDPMALSEAQRAVSLDPSSARAQAILCRVLDWTDQIDAAVAAGRRAVSLSDREPLARLFLGEALSDRGDGASAGAELSAAALLTRSASSYQRAEVEREQANLAFDQGDGAAQLSHLRAALAVQPGWVERASELAAAAFSAGDIDQARQAFDRALALAPDDVPLLQGLGAAALLQSDYITAARALRRALPLQPRAGILLDLSAQVAIALDHDAASAEALLQRALEAHPDDAQAAAYLLNLARDVGHDQARGRLEIAIAVRGADELAPRPARTVPDPDAAVADHAQRALAAVNRVRAAAGLAPVVLDTRLSAAALAHTYYWLFNNASPAVAKLGIHRETAGTLGFTGVRAADRAQAFDYSAGPVGEDITHRGSADAAVRDWVDSVYHRMPILRPDLRAIGYADATLGPLPMEDMEFGFAAAGSPGAAPVAYPPDGADRVPTTFVDNELPDPVPAGGPRVTGYPVTVTFPVGVVVRVSAFSLSGPDGTPVDAFLLAPSADTENSASLLPHAALQPGTRYTARLRGTVGGRPYARAWSFTTAGVDQGLVGAHLG
jgi:uncharacterized protein YkwD